VACWGLPACQVSSWSVQPFGHNTPTSQTDRQTDRQDRQRSDSIGRTVLQTVAQNTGYNSKMLMASFSNYPAKAIRKLLVCILSGVHICSAGDMPQRQKIIFGASEVIWLLTLCFKLLSLFTLYTWQRHARLGSSNIHWFFAGFISCSHECGVSSLMLSQVGFSTAS